VLVSKVMTYSSDEGADAIANYASVSWYNEDCDSSQSGDNPYNPLCNSDVLGTPPLVAFASRATNLVQDPPKPQDYCEANIFCANIFLAWKGRDYVQALTLGGDFTQYPKGDAMFPTLSRDGKFVVFQSASEYFDVEGSDETPETDIWLIDLRPEQEDRNPYLVSNFNTSTGNDVNADSGNVRCRLNPEGELDCETYSNGTTKPQVEYPHPVADVYWRTNQSGGQPDIYHDVFVAFESLASNLAENDRNGHIKDIFLGQPSDKGHNQYNNQYPRSEGSLLLTRAPECDSQSPEYGEYINPTNGDSYHPVFVDMPGKDQDGRYLLFVSRATNLICGLDDQDYQPDNPNAHWLERRANIFLLDRD
jgi:hypothetical protein